MNAKPARNSIFLAAGFVIALMSITAFTINYYFFQFPGNNYFPSEGLISGLYLLCAYTAAGMYFDFDHYAVDVLHNISILYITFALIALLTSAIQLTPFNPVDGTLIAWENRLGINMADFMLWTAQHPQFKRLMITSYDSVPYQMSVLPFILGFFGLHSKLKEFYCLMLITAIIGFGFYYLFPTTAPASNISSPFFSATQHDTGLKFKQIHEHIKPTTREGGMIALPSFHVIWAWLCLYLARAWRPLLIFFIPLNIVLALSCVLLGWHYTIDLAGSVITLVLAHGIYQYLDGRNKQRSNQEILAGTPVG